MKIREKIHFISSIFLVLSFILVWIPRPFDSVYASTMPTRTEANYLTPRSSPEENYKRIQYCLDNYKIAKLAPGVFNITQELILNNDSELTCSENNLTWPTIQLVSPSNDVVAINGNNCKVTMLTINYNNKYIEGNWPCKSALIVSGKHNFVANCHIKGGDNPQRKSNLDEVSLNTMTGVYIFGDDNTIYNCQIYNNTYGVIFANEGRNKIDNCGVFYNKSDGITLTGYGEILNSNIHHNGYDCDNGWISDDDGTTLPIPGAGIYSIGNVQGALLQGNTIYDNNGNGIDISDGENFIIDNNYTYDPGNREFPEASDYVTCSYGQGVAMLLCNVKNFSITNNTVENNRTSNFVDNTVYKDYGTNRFFSSRNGQGYSDLPNGGNQVIAFVLAETDGTENHTIQNVIKNNSFRSSASGSCVGLGYFASRGTGFGQTGSSNDDYWGADSTNYFTLNKSFGSDIGSRRCGGNWYAANGEDSNDDDSQHIGDGYDWAGNDEGCAHY